MQIWFTKHYHPRRQTKNTEFRKYASVAAPKALTQTDRSRAIYSGGLHGVGQKDDGKRTNCALASPPPSPIPLPTPSSSPIPLILHLQHFSPLPTAGVTQGLIKVLPEDSGHFISAGDRFADPVDQSGQKGGGVALSTVPGARLPRTSPALMAELFMRMQLRLTTGGTCRRVNSRGMSVAAAGSGLSLSLLLLLLSASTLACDSL